MPIIPALPIPRAMRLPFLVAAALVAALPALAADPVGGADVVSLRDSGRLIAGKARIQTEWKGHAWTFANEANRAAFEANPRAYAPAFGGNCPVALSEGRRQPGSAQFFVVVGGTLYLTSGREARQKMQTDPQPILSRAGAAWNKGKR